MLGGCASRGLVRGKTKRAGQNGHCALPVSLAVKASTRSFSSGTTSSLKGKTALVTGSTSGIGLGIASSLAKAGCNVMVNGLGQKEEIDRALTELRGHGTRIEFNGADLSKRDQVTSLVAETLSVMGSVDVLVNNAGIQHVSSIQAFPDDMWEKVIAINLSSAFYSMKAAIPSMTARKWGRIINIASVHGLVASANKSAYVAAKHGLVGLSKTASLELAGTGVTVNCINPGWTRTQLVERQIEAKAKQMGVSIEEAARELLAEKQPSKQFVMVEHLGDTAVFLCSEAASQITGISIPIDGGWTAQ